MADLPVVRWARPGLLPRNVPRRMVEQVGPRKEGRARPGRQGATGGRPSHPDDRAKNPPDAQTDQHTRAGCASVEPPSLCCQEAASVIGQRVQKVPLDISPQVFIVMFDSNRFVNQVFSAGAQSLGDEFWPIADLKRVRLGDTLSNGRNGT